MYLVGEGASDGTPLYGRITRVLRDRILTGEWPEGMALPTIEQLMDDFGVGRATIREALQQLSRQQLIETGRGKSTRVLPHKKVDTATSFGLISTAPNLNIRLLKTHEGVELPSQLSQDLSPAPRYCKYSKTYERGGLIQAFMEIYVDEALNGKLTHEAVEKHPIYVLLQKELGDPTTITSQRMRIGVADQHIALHLNCPLGETVVEWTRIMYSKDDKRPMYAGNFYYLASHYQMEFTCELQQLGNMMGVAASMGLAVS